MRCYPQVSWYWQGCRSSLCPSPRPVGLRWLHCQMTQSKLRENTPLSNKFWSLPVHAQGALQQWCAKQNRFGMQATDKCALWSRHNACFFSKLTLGLPNVFVGHQYVLENRTKFTEMFSQSIGNVKSHSTTPKKSSRSAACNIFCSSKRQYLTNL